MTKPKQTDVIDAGDLRKYRTEIPNSIDDMGLSVYAFRLYAHLKRVAGDSGQCYQGKRKMAEVCGMSPAMIPNAKRELIDRGLIRVTPGDAKTQTADLIVIVDIWRENFLTFAKSYPGHTVTTPGQDMTSPGQDMTSPGHAVDGSGQDVTTPGHTVDPKNKPLKKEPLKKEPIKKEPREEVYPSAAPKDARTPPHTPLLNSPITHDKPHTPQQEMYSAICDIMALDFHIIPDSKKVQIAQTVRVLSDGGYTLDDLRRFFLEIWAKDWRWEKKQQRPTLTELRQEIGKLRASIPIDMPINGHDKPTGAAAVRALRARLEAAK